VTDRQIDRQIAQNNAFLRVKCFMKIYAYAENDFHVFVLVPSDLDL